MLNGVSVFEGTGLEDASIAAATGQEQGVLCVYLNSNTTYPVTVTSKETGELEGIEDWQSFAGCKFRNVGSKLVNTILMMQSANQIQLVTASGGYGTENKPQFPLGLCLMDVGSEFLDMSGGRDVEMLGGVPYLKIADGYVSLPRSIENKLKQIEQLNEGWDGYTASSVSGKATGLARLVLRKATDILGEHLPSIVPTSRGGIGFEWREESGKELLLEISSDGGLSYLLVVPEPGGGEKETESDLSKVGELTGIFLTFKK